MKASISIEQQSGLYYGSGEWYIKINIDCKSVHELKRVLSKLKEITETLEGEEE